jgi:hypothetical protein
LQQDTNPARSREYALAVFALKDQGELLWRHQMNPFFSASQTGME